ncbi:MAG: alpha/beta fold hydrolase [Flavobacteriia bacterium]
MPLRVKLLKYHGIQLEYLVIGDGHEVIICLHGHGRPAEDFLFLENNKRKVISLRLFYHGGSYFPEDRIEKSPLSTEEFVELFQLILQNESINEFHLFAFSQGGRFTLSIMPFFAEKINSVTLLAPDGMDNNSFYNWSSRQKWARALFQKYEKNPSRLLKQTKIAVKLKLMRPKVRTFVDEFASDPETMRRASLTWRAFRNIQPNTDMIKKTLKKKLFPFLIIMGSYDQVIRPKQAYKFALKIGYKDCVIEIQNGHHFFKPSSILRIKELLPF